MEINWQGHDVLNDFQIHLMCRYATNPGSGLTNNSFIPNQQERANGSYIISKSYFNQEEEIYEALVFMNSQKKGTIDSRFRIYSEITSTFKIDSNCDVN